MSDDDPGFDMRDYGYPTELPKGAVQVGPKVAYTWREGQPKEIENLTIWHWCDHNLWAANPSSNPDYLPYEGWVPTGVGAHDLMAVEPLHLEPSIYWPGCCGRHGFLRGDVWTDA